MPINPHCLEDHETIKARIEHIMTHPLPPLTHEVAEHMADIILDGQHRQEMAEHLGYMTDGCHTLRSLTAAELLLFIRATADRMADNGSPSDELLFGLLVNGHEASRHLEHAHQILQATDSIEERSEFIATLLRADRQARNEMRWS